MNQLQTLQRRVYTAPHGKKRQREQELRKKLHDALGQVVTNERARLTVEGV